MTEKTLTILRADFADQRHAADLVWLLDDYARDPMGGGKPLGDHARQHLAETLAGTAGAFSVLAYVDGEAAGLVNAFQGFSTFKCKPLINIHDVTVRSSFRGLGLSRKMLDEVELIARERGCCKLTLEVLSGNTVAKEAYRRFGFDAYSLDSEAGTAQFWEKTL